MLKGVDVSSARGVIDWARAKAAGVQFALLRCGFGSDDPTQDDAQFEANVDGCEANGIPWGAYLYSYALNLDDAESEVRHILRLLAGKRPEYPIYIDMEDADGYKEKCGMPSNDMLVDICEHVCSCLEGAGYYAGIYANKDWLTNRLNDEKLDRYDKWLAQWSDKPTYDGQYGVWQYANSGTIDGITGRADLNQTTEYRDYPAYIRDNKLNGWGADIPAAAASAPDPSPAADITAGDTVHYSGHLYGDSYGNNPGQTVEGDFAVDRVIANREYGVHVVAGWLKASACEKAGSVSDSEPVLSIGDKVKIKSGITKFADGTNIASFIRNASVLYVRQLGNGKALISTVQSGDVTGWIKSEDLISA